MFSKEDVIYVAGHNGMVGSAIVRQLKSLGFERIIARSHQELDLTNQAAVHQFFREENIDVVFLAAAKVGGIQANNVYRADFIYQNLMIQCNVIHAAFESGVERLLFLGSSCIYPRQCRQPMREEDLLSGYLEPTNEPYAIAKIAGIKLCESYNRQHGTQYRAVMPTNLYGPNDNFDLEKSHVLPAMIRKFHLTKLAQHGDFDTIEKDVLRFGPIPDVIWRDLKKDKPVVGLWGTGTPRREFLHVDDMAAGSLYVMQMSDAQYRQACSVSKEKADNGDDVVPHLNVGYGSDITLKELAQTVQNVVGFQGDVFWDATKPDGMKVKLMDSSRLIQAGWEPRINLQSGIEKTYGEYLEQLGSR